MRLSALFSFIFLLITGIAGASDGGGRHSGPAKDPASFPKPPITTDRLFYVQRDPNANTIVYDINMGSDGQPDADEPVKVYWIKYAEKGQRQDLNFIQRKFAYGINAKPLGNGSYDIRFVSYKKFGLTLKKASDGKYHIFTTILQKQAILSSIFVKVEGGSFWFPNVPYVEVKGIDPQTNKEMVERFKP